MNRFTLLALAFFLAFIGVGVFLMRPSYQELSAILQQVKEKKAVLQIRESITGHFKELREELTKYEKELKKIDSALPEDPELPALYDLIQSFSALSGLIVESVTSLPPQEISEDSTSSLKITSLEVHLMGSYQGLKEFLSRLKASPRVLNVQTLTILTEEKKEGLRFQLNLEAYSY